MRRFAAYPVFNAVLEKARTAHGTCAQGGIHGKDENSVAGIRVAVKRQMRFGLRNRPRLEIPHKLFGVAPPNRQAEMDVIDREKVN